MSSDSMPRRRHRGDEQAVAVQNQPAKEGRMIIKLRRPEGEFESTRCLNCGIDKRLDLNPNATFCDCCSAILHSVRRREFFVEISEEYFMLKIAQDGASDVHDDARKIVQEGIDLYLKEHEPISREWTKEDRDFLKALMVGVEP